MGATSIRDGTRKDTERHRRRARLQDRHARAAHTQFRVHGTHTPISSISRTSGAMPSPRIPSRMPGVTAATLEAMLRSQRTTPTARTAPRTPPRGYDLFTHHASSLQTRRTRRKSFASIEHPTECLYRSPQSQGAGWNFSRFYLMGSGSLAGTACPAVQRTNTIHPRTRRIQRLPSFGDLCDGPGWVLSHITLPRTPTYWSSSPCLASFASPGSTHSGFLSSVNRAATGTTCSAMHSV